MQHAAPQLNPIEAPALKLPGIAHAFFTREGGVSTGIYRGLNTGIGSDDAREAVLENSGARAARRLGAASETLATLQQMQVHSADAIFLVEMVWAPGPGTEGRRRRDQSVRASQSVREPPIAVRCSSPMRRRGVVAAAHAGWRGAFTGILEPAPIAAMGEAGAARTDNIAVLGPNHSPRTPTRSGRSSWSDSCMQMAQNARFFAPSSRTGHSMFDLPAYIVARLEAAGIAEPVQLAV